MPIRFYDPRNNTITHFSTELIQIFMNDLEYTYNQLARQEYAAKRLASPINKSIYDLSSQKSHYEYKLKEYLFYISRLNKENKTLPYVEFDLYKFEYALLDIFENHNIPVRLVIDYYSTLGSKNIAPLITGKQCIKSVYHKDDAFIRTDNLKFINALISTDIYEFNTDDVEINNKISFLISSNKLIILKLQLFEEDDFSESFKDLLASWNPDLILRELSLENVLFKLDEKLNYYYGPDYNPLQEFEKLIDLDAQLLAAMIQSNKHLQKISFKQSRLSADFINLLTTYLNAIPISGTQSVSLDFSYNRYFSGYINNFVTCLNQAAISELNLTGCELSDNNIRHLSVALRTNTILTSLNLSRSRIRNNLGSSIADLCRAIIDNPDSQLVKLDLSNMNTLIIEDYTAIGELIEADKLYELYLLDANVHQADKRYIFDIVTRALWNNYYLTMISFPINYLPIEEGYEDPRLFLKALLFRKPIPLNIINLADELMVRIMKMLIENYNISSKTLIDILNEY